MSALTAKIDERYEYQRYIIDYLVKHDGYVERDQSYYDYTKAMDTELLIRFLDDTQPEKMETLRKIFKENAEETIINTINDMVMNNSSILSLLKHGVDITNIHLDLLYRKPATDYNPELTGKYNSSIFSVMQEVYADKNKKERINLVIFVNGMAIISFELKSNSQGQNYEDAIYQYRTQRNPKDRLFLFKAGCLVNFAMDLEEVYMTTKLEGEKTNFMPFNKGKGEGMNAGAGNPSLPDDYDVSYMWKDILTKDTLVELITKFIFLDSKRVKNEDTGNKELSERIIFPRYHQLDAIRKILADVKVNKTARNYLIQHSAGSGKTNTISWLAHRLTSLHDDSNNAIFDTIIIMTDRVVVDRQLQHAIMGIEHQPGLVQVMDDNATSVSLQYALENNTKIVVTTIQKFPYVVDLLNHNDDVKLKEKTFAVIIDEAHSSTAGKDMAAVEDTLSTFNGERRGQNEDEDVEELLNREIERSGKQKNVSFFAFTATPKPTTLRLFGIPKINKAGKPYYQAFHLYTMKQAIEEGYILDVLSNYTTFDTYYELNKKVKDDPKLNTADAKRQIWRLIDLNKINIAQRTNIIVEHFHDNVMNELGGKAKAMVITASREAAVRYYFAFKKSIQEHGYRDMDALVAFSGKVKFPDNDTEYSEAGINHFGENKTAEEFKKSKYKFLIVANKYQVGFDQPKLTAMYVIKKLHGVNAVQTLSRLNRIYPPYKKTPFVLDFVNDYKDIEKAFKPYYTTTLLANTVDPQKIYNLVEKIQGYYLIDPIDVEQVTLLLHKDKGRISASTKKQIKYYMERTQRKFKEEDPDDQSEFLKTLKHFVRYYEFLLQISSLKDVDLQKLYLFVINLLSYLDLRRPGKGYDLTGKIKASKFNQGKGQEHKKGLRHSDPVVSLPQADAVSVGDPDEKKLSEIIADINSRLQKPFDSDVTVKSLMQIRDLMMNSDKLKISAKNNSEQDFKLAYYKQIDKALIKGLAQNQQFFTYLLNNEDVKKKALGLFTKEIYATLKDE